MNTLQQLFPNIGGQGLPTEVQYTPDRLQRKRILKAEALMKKLAIVALQRNLCATSIGAGLVSVGDAARNYNYGSSGMTFGPMSDAGATAEWLKEVIDISFAEEVDELIELCNTCCQYELQR